MKQIILALICGLLLGVSCSPETNSKKNDGKEEGKLYIVCTTQMIANAVSKVAGEKAKVVGLMGPGVDPHLYKATQGDIKKLTEADAIFYNGLLLEGKMAEVFEKMNSSKNVVAVGESIQKKKLIPIVYQGKESAFDPHIWHSAILWAETLEPIKRTLQKMEPENAAIYEKNAAAFRNELLELHSDIKARISTIPKTQRLMVTSHDAFSYFGRDYDIDVDGLQGISTVSEVGIKDVTNMVDMLSSRNVKAVFVESSVPRKPLEAVIQGCKDRGHKVVIGGTLYSDAMGDKGTPEGEYIGMLNSNVNIIVNALR